MYQNTTSAAAKSTHFMPQNLFEAHNKNKICIATLENNSMSIWSIFFVEVELACQTKFCLPNSRMTIWTLQEGYGPWHHVVQMIELYLLCLLCFFFFIDLFDELLSFPHNFLPISLALLFLLQAPRDLFSAPLSPSAIPRDLFDGPHEEPLVPLSLTPYVYHVLVPH